MPSLTRRHSHNRRLQYFDLRCNIFSITFTDHHRSCFLLSVFSSIVQTWANEGLLNDAKRHGTPSAHTVQAYVNALLESYFFYEIKRFDIKGKSYLRTLGKYYIVDIGLRNYLLGMRNRDRGYVIENVVYFELLRRGFDVVIGKIGNSEIDFIATTAVQKLYIQVTESMVSEDVRKRELSPLQAIHDNYEKIVLSLEMGLDSSYEGIKSINLIDWLLDDSIKNHRDLMQ